MFRCETAFARHLDESEASRGKLKPKNNARIMEIGETLDNEYPPKSKTADLAAKCLQEPLKKVAEEACEAIREAQERPKTAPRRAKMVAWRVFSPP